MYNIYECIYDLHNCIRANFTMCKSLLFLSLDLTGCVRTDNLACNNTCNSLLGKDLDQPIRLPYPVPQQQGLWNIYMGMRGSGETINPKSSAAIARCNFSWKLVSPQPFHSNFPCFLVFNVSFTDFPTRFIQFSQLALWLLRFPSLCLATVLGGSLRRSIWMTTFVLGSAQRFWLVPCCAVYIVKVGS